MGRPNTEDRQIAYLSIVKPVEAYLYAHERYHATKEGTERFRFWLDHLRRIEAKSDAKQLREILVALHPDISPEEDPQS